MYILAVVISTLAFGLLVGVRGQVIALTMASATIAVVLIVFLWRGYVVDAGFIIGTYIIGFLVGTAFRWWRQDRD